MNTTISNSFFAMVVAGLCLSLSSAVMAQEVFSADMVGEVPAAQPDTTPLADLNPKLVVTVFEQACVLTGGQAPAAIDWALTNDFVPADVMSGSAEGLLEGQPGTVMVAPGTDGRVMLAVSASQCSVWAERTPGPPLRSALAAMVVTLTAKGHKAQVTLDRSVERAGAWRNQMQWRYRAVGTQQDWGLGAVTTLANTPGTQVLHFAPVGKVANYAPDGVPAR